MSEYADWVDDAREPNPWHDCEECGARQTADILDRETDRWVCRDCATTVLL